MSIRQPGKYWVVFDGEWIISRWDGYCWQDEDHFGFQDDDYERLGPRLINPDGKPA